MVAKRQRRTQVINELREDTKETVAAWLQNGHTFSTLSSLLSLVVVLPCSVAAGQRQLVPNYFAFAANEEHVVH